MSALEDLHRSSGDHRIVWEVLYAYDYIHRVSVGYDDDRYSHTTREQSITHIVAPTLEMAEFAFAHRLSSYEFVSATPLCTINYEIGIAGERYI